MRRGKAGRYKVGLANNSVAPHVLVGVGGLPDGLTVDDFIELIDAVEAGAPPPEGACSAPGHVRSPVTHDRLSGAERADREIHRVPHVER